MHQQRRLLTRPTAGVLLRYAAESASENRQALSKMSGAPRAATQRIAGRARLCGCSVTTYTTATRGYVGTGPRYDEGICKAWSGHAHRNMRWRRRTPSKKDHMKRKFKIPARATPSSLRSSSEGVRSECSEARRPARSLHRQGISRIPRRAAPQVVCAAE